MNKELRLKLDRLKKNLDNGHNLTNLGPLKAKEIYNMAYGPIVQGFRIHFVDLNHKNRSANNMVAIHEDCYLRYNDPQNREKALKQTREEIKEWSDWYYSQIKNT